MSIEWFSAINHLREFMLEVNNALKILLLSEPLEAYMQSALTCFYATYRENAYREVLSNPLLRNSIMACSRFINAVDKLSSTTQSLLGQTILYSIMRIENCIKTSGKKTFLILCDCLSLPEYAFIFTWYTCRSTTSDIFF